MPDGNHAEDLYALKRLNEATRISIDSTADDEGIIMDLSEMQWAHREIATNPHIKDEADRTRELEHLDEWFVRRSEYFQKAG